MTMMINAKSIPTIKLIKKITITKHQTLIIKLHNNVKPISNIFPELTHYNNRTTITLITLFLFQITNNSQMHIRNQSESRHLRVLLLINFLMLVGHFSYDSREIWYFFQLTIIGQILVVLNFYLSIVLHQDKSNLRTQLLLSRFHLITLSLESIIVIGYWSLRVFFPKGIISDKQRGFMVEMFSVWVHGGSFVSMFYFIKKDQIVTQTQKRKKVLFHLLWAIPFCFLQWIRFYFTGEHIYGFIKYFDWVQLIVFEVALFSVAISVDYLISVRHGFKLLKNLQEHGGSRGHLHVKAD